MKKSKTEKKNKLKNSHIKKNLTRKELRKQKQLQKKENKRVFFSNKKQDEVVNSSQHNTNKKFDKVNVKKNKNANNLAKPISVEQMLSGDVLGDDDESIESDFEDEEVNARLPVTMAAKRKEDTQHVNAKKAKTHVVTRPDASEVHKREKQRQKDLENASKKQRVKQFLLENEEEDKVISRLEKKLKLNKTKDKNRLVRKMFNDGLDYALEFCLDDDEEEQKLLLKEKRKQQQQQQANDFSDEDLYENEEETKNGDDISSGDDSGDDTDGSGSDSEGLENCSEDIDTNIDESENEKLHEDIYGRKIDKDGNVVNDDTTLNETDTMQKYVPPHQRALLATKDNNQTEILERLRKNCKGQLNRLSEANLHKIAVAIEDMYMKNSRFNMNKTLTLLLKEILISKTIAKERMVQEHMVLLAYLHAHIGNEIGAHFLQIFIEEFDKLVREAEAISLEDKSLNNLVLVLSYMYIFKIYEHRLLLEIVERLTHNLCEKTIECLLLIFQSVGFKLRKDDPLAFKQMLLNVHKKIAEAPLEMKENLRLKFMVDILTAVKNNNSTKIPQFDPELAENLRKRLKAMLRNDKYVITLNITIEDLLRADQVGKWWIVGSAWSGNINDLGAATKNNNDTKNDAMFSEKLLALAKKQKMNTDERRNLFCIIMSAEDYVDAFEKILHLSLKDQRSIAYVIIHCCLNEKLSNPYYSHLALKFCNYNRKYQLAFQFASWDRINDIDSLTKQQIKNLAKFLQHLIINGGLVLSVLKVVDFLQLDKQSFLFMKEVIVDLLLTTDENQVYQCFERVAKNIKLRQFKNSLRLFMQHFLLNEGGDRLKLSDVELELLTKRVEHVDNILALVDL
ncbi:nucleolar MIF4G domain-containing protein 1 homolog [Teleopsis dalmanni]|uniref:nucleolar MIF4G domain-containing protein 1 homolog n=1 Tax=Teleopsis dalmanni TaxID=139649 RepID=UPI0018CD6632|nr:nucleolar MIF4G domain-containing protein 1 homolog [Teleopsis dalmanni]